MTKEITTPTSSEIITEQKKIDQQEITNSDIVNILGQTQKDTFIVQEKQQTSQEKLKRFFTPQKEIVINDKEDMWEELIRENGRQKTPLKLKISPLQNIIEFTENVIYEKDTKWYLMLTKWMQLMDYKTCLEGICKKHHCTPEDVEENYLITKEELEEEMKNKPNWSLRYEIFFKRELSPFGIGSYYMDEQTNRLKERIKWEGNVYMRLAKGDMAIFGSHEWSIIRINGANGFLGIWLIANW